MHKKPPTILSLLREFLCAHGPWSCPVRVRDLSNSPPVLRPDNMPVDAVDQASCRDHYPSKRPRASCSIVDALALSTPFQICHLPKVLRQALRTVVGWRRPEAPDLLNVTGGEGKNKTMDDDWYRDSRRPRQDQSMEPVRSSDWKRWKGARRMGIVQLNWPCRKVFEEAGKRWKIVQEFDNYTTILYTKDNEDWEKYPMKKELLCSFGPLIIPTPLI